MRRIRYIFLSSRFLSYLALSPKTGIRDKDMLKTVENNLLDPVRETLGRWMTEPIDRSSKFSAGRFLIW